MSHNKPLLYYFVSYGDITTKPVDIGLELEISVLNMAMYIPVFSIPA